MTSLKKAIFGVGAAVVLGGLIFGGDLFSYVRTAGTAARETVEDQIPIEFQIKRLRDMLNNELEPEISKMKKAVAKSQVEVERMTAKLEQRAGEMATKRVELAERVGEIKSGKTTFSIKGVTYTKAEIEEDLNTRVSHAEEFQKILVSEQKVLDAKKKAMDANEDKVARLLSARETVALQIEQLEARLSAVQAAETVVGSDFDESKLKRIESLLDELNVKVDVREHELAIEGKETALIPVETEESSQSVLDRASALLGESASDQPVVDADN
jgi:hypothetical protein